MRGKSTTLGSVIVGFALICVASQGHAGKGDMPSEGLLEFLGSWEEEDEDWLTIALEMAETENAGRSGRSDSSAEADDEKD